jgi:hypothetical protein
LPSPHSAHVRKPGGFVKAPPPGGNLPSGEHVRETREAIKIVHELFFLLQNAVEGDSPK